MLIALIGENCTGKTYLSNMLKQKLGATIYVGSEYLRFAEKEADARLRFSRILEKAAADPSSTIYLINEMNQLPLLPEKCIRVLVTAPMEDIESRFAARMNGILPSAVAYTLRKNHGLFDKVPHHVHVHSGKNHVLEDCARILALCDGRE